jgi:L-asparaginase / beta-aspartyl-peptidase
MQKNFAIAVHGGAGGDSDFIRSHLEAYKEGIKEAVSAGYAVLQNGGDAAGAVKAAIIKLEDNPLFNAGRGSALNENAEVEMCSSIMDGTKMKFGATAIVRNVRNPVELSAAIMENSEQLYLGDDAATRYAEKMQVKMEPAAYFITDHAYEDHRKKMEELNKATAHRSHGTVGAVALDAKGNLAAATSTGGAAGSKAGRIGDSSMIGSGTYANGTCAVSATGDGEYNILYVTAFHIAALMEYKGMSAAAACSYFIDQKMKGINADIGMIVMDKAGEVHLDFNSTRMFRGWQKSNGPVNALVYKDE